MQKLFISYSRKDIGFARKLAGDLEKAGYEVWWDITDLRGGDDWVRVIPEAIASSDSFIVALSPDGVASEWVKKEYTQALSLRKRIIPIMLTMTTVPFALNTINYLDFTSEDGYTDSLNALLRDLGYTGEPVAPVSTRPRTLRWYVLTLTLILLTFLTVLVFARNSTPQPVSTPTLTPSLTFTVIPSLTATDTPTPNPTPSVTLTVTSTVTETLTPRPTSTPTVTRPPFDILIFCVNSLYANSINVRSGPGTIYAPIGEPLLVGECLAFRGRNEEATWLLIAPGQTDPNLQQYEGGWIFRELLGLGEEGPIDLPAVTLTPTPTPSDTPTVTPTATPTPSFTPTSTPTDSPTPTETPAPSETATSAS
ncbi:MAG TPA: toll/interleukin-1 receptor domain-containing protein [Anaerolineales bacterium]|nr:toll/interleukin-1 receptor domain-containing protein [Anaerolineales bacterium]